MQQVFGFPQRFNPPANLDWYVMSNEDVGFTASLVTGTNESYQFAMPYPASFDLETESLIVYALEQYLQFEHEYNTAGSNYFSLTSFLSMLKKDLLATNRGQAVDTEDEFYKAQFASNITMGQSGPPAATVNITGLGSEKFDTVQDSIYYPPIPMDLVVPLYVTLVNSSKQRTLATNAAADLTFSAQETYSAKAWFTTRRLSRTEIDAKAMQVRWQRLDS